MKFTGITRIALLVVVISTITIGAKYLGLYSRWQSTTYDLFLHTAPPVPEDPRLLLVDIDDPTIATINMYPLSRDIMADGLVLLREAGAETAILDIEFVDTSPRGVNESYLTGELPERFAGTFDDLDEYARGIVSALADGRISPEDAAAFLDGFSETVEVQRESLLSDVLSVVRDNDEYLGRSLAIFGNSYATVNMLDGKDPTVPDRLMEYTKSGAYNSIRVDTDPFAVAAGIKPTIFPILSRSAGFGFPRVYVDPDGVRRRIDLFYRYDTAYFPQLGFAALLHLAEYPQVDVDDRRVLIHDPAPEARLQPAETEAESPDGNTDSNGGGKPPAASASETEIMEATGNTIRIPLTEDGRMLIRWPNKKYEESFRHLSFLSLYRHDLLIRDLAHNLQIMADQNFILFHQGTDPLTLYRYGQELRGTLFETAGKVYRDPTARPSAATNEIGNLGSHRELQKLREGIGGYRQVRDGFVAEANAFLNGPAEDAVLGEFDRVIGSARLATDQRSDLIAKRNQVPILFEKSREILFALEEERNTIIDAAQGSICVVGYIGTSTTDIGVTPFESEYMNMGLYASAVNTILTGEFNDDTPAWVPALLAVLLAALVCTLIERLKPGVAVIVGFGAVVMVVGILILVFRRTGIFLEPIAPGFAVAASFLSMTSIQFIQTSRERTFIRSAFGQYLSGEVISELVEEGQSPHLGGREVYMTAMFTDVQKFSTISEMMTPTDLVSLLNEYLTAMSNIVLDQRGTIDKYEGDAIICFFGAPREFPDHAALACAAAVAMKKTEAEINRRFLDEGTAPRELLTRIGINTGEMVVGNMGTERKMDYTIMGNAVNLAARLEGVNKVYGTWILVSEATANEAGEGFLKRRLDRVRVVGINTPVRLYNVVDMKDTADPVVVEGIDTFHAGLDEFEARNWEKAESCFEKSLAALPEDGPSKTYLERVETYKKKEPPKDWEGVFNLTEK
jgi:adenylate cyclase